MGPEDSEKYTAFILVDGEPVKIAPGIYHYSVDVVEQTDLKLMDYEITVKMKLPKPMRCKSRKRFVKLLMASRFDRNAAQALAKWCVIRRNQRDVPECLKTSYQGRFIDLWMRGLVNTERR